MATSSPCVTSRDFVENMPQPWADRTIKRLVIEHGTRRGTKHPIELPKQVRAVCDLIRAYVKACVAFDEERVADMCIALKAVGLKPPVNEHVVASANRPNSQHLDRVAAYHANEYFNYINRHRR